MLGCGEMKKLRKICPDCGGKADIELQYCDCCGHQFYEDGENSRIPVCGRHFRGYLLVDIRSCVGKNYDVYMQKFTRLRKGKFSFNWSSAIFGIEWMCYRKMWKYAAWFLGITQACSILIYIGVIMWIRSLNVSDILSNNVRIPNLYWVQESGKLLWFIIFGLAGDPLYWRTVKKKLDDRNCFQRPPYYDREIEENLRRSGGPLSAVQTVGMLILLAICVWGIETLIMAAGSAYLAYYFKSMGL